MPHGRHIGVPYKLFALQPAEMVGYDTRTIYLTITRSIAETKQWHHLSDWCSCEARRNVRHLPSTSGASKTSGESSDLATSSTNSTSQQFIILSVRSLAVASQPRHLYTKSRVSN